MTCGPGEDRCIAKTDGYAVKHCPRHAAVDRLVEALKNAVIEDERRDGMGWRVRRLCKKALKAAGEEVN